MYHIDKLITEKSFPHALVSENDGQTKVFCFRRRDLCDGLTVREHNPPILMDDSWPYQEVRVSIYGAISCAMCLADKEKKGTV